MERPQEEPAADADDREQEAAGAGLGQPRRWDQRERDGERRDRGKRRRGALPELSPALFDRFQRGRLEIPQPRDARVAPQPFRFALPVVPRGWGPSFVDPANIVPTRDAAERETGRPPPGGRPVP